MAEIPVADKKSAKYKKLELPEEDEDNNEIDEREERKTNKRKN